MPYVIAQPCVDVKNGACVEVCPVDCIHTTPEEPQHYIDPDVCIECEQCVLVCPVEAVFLDRDLPEEWQDYSEINAAFFKRRKEGAEPVPEERALRMIRAAHAKAAEIGVSVSVTVVDWEQRTVAFASMDGAPEPSAKAASSRAIATVTAFRAPAADLTPVMIQSGPKGAVVPAIDAKVAQTGAMPIMEGVNVIGAIGVAGGTDEQDQQACRAGLSAFV
jgi:ferredoxin